MLPQDKLDAILARHDELNAHLAEASDPVLIVKLSKELSTLTALVPKIRAYANFETEQAELIEMLDDPDMRAMASEELAELRSRHAEDEKELRIALLPRDAADEGGAILEVRAGTGGDEAALFAGDLFRMYQRYADFKGWTVDDRQSLRDEVPKNALDARFRRMRVLDLAREALDISRHGLAARKKLDDKGQDETRYIDCLSEIAKSGRTTADDMLEKFNGKWQGKTDPVFAEYEY